MPVWDELLEEFNKVPNAGKSAWLQDHVTQDLQRVSAVRGGRHVILYGSGFLQKPLTPGAFTQISHEDLNGFMTAIHGMDVGRGLSLIIHTPGGVTNAAETLVHYIRSKFTDVEVIIPAFAMSAGTMISLAGDRILMGRQSQLGPIDPLLQHAGRLISAQAVVDQFDDAKDQVKSDLTLAHVWAPILTSLGPSLLHEAKNALA